MFGLALLTAGTLLQLHVGWRALTLPWLARGRRRAIALAVLLALWGALVLGWTYGHHRSDLLARGLEWTGMNWLAALFLQSVCLWPIELATGFGLWCRRQAPALRAGALALGLLLSGIALLQGHRAPVVEAYAITLPALPPARDGTRVVALSDLHLGDRVGAAWLAERVQQVQALQPDLVLLLGDLVEGHGAPSPALLPALRGLRAPLGVFAVSGNHDAETSLALLEQAGVQLLRQRWVEPAPGLVLAGVDDVRLHGDDVGALHSALAGRPAGATLLLSHRAALAAQAAAQGVDLMLSGHTHGGQIWPFDLLVARVHPQLEGRSTVDGMPVLVSRGASTWGPRMRLFARGEIVQITLRAH